MNSLSAVLIALFASSPALAVDPPRSKPVVVNIWAQRAEDDRIVQNVRRLIDEQLELPSRKNLEKIGDELEKLKDGKLSTATYSELIKFQNSLPTYLDVGGREAITTVSEKVAHVFVSHARQGFLSQAVVEEIMDHSKGGRLADVVRIATHFNPSLATRSLKAKTQDAFLRAIKEAKTIDDVWDGIYHEGEAETLLRDPTAQKKLSKLIAAVKRKEGYSELLMVNPKLAPLIEDFKIPTHAELKLAISLRHASEKGWITPPGQLFLTIEESDSLTAKIEKEIYGSVYDAAEAQIQKTLRLPSERVKNVERDIILSAIEMAKNGREEQLVDGLKEIAKADWPDDSARNSIIEVLDRYISSKPVEASRYQEFRRDIGEALGKLQARTPEQQARMVELRRGGLRVLPPGCPGGFGDLVGK